MKIYGNAQKLIDWLRVHQPATMVKIVSTGMMQPRTVRDAVQYAMRQGAVERIRRPGASSNERGLYQLTGRPLQERINNPTGPSFDGLLSAWGIARVPPQLPSEISCRCRVADEWASP
ncbi:hypothetical protein G3A43_41905 [Paraburkholderia aspalathi]|uniref:hypothetical protein n=1 Tax=Paraburkholderia nemoris TaxID=2793076 RepID=UPI00190CF1A5|nr:MULTISPECIES: hypothetical protein [Paraburkholderia]MBK3786742.1 hypothetical protein [Paraburkholderia aspalathi]